jgi:hypothetical protein
MTPEQNQLHTQLKKFQLDDPNSDFPFSARLALENHWDLAYSIRVIDEYKRFAFLAVFAGHPVTPSMEVDEAWHLHLLYTDNYWNLFCGEILQKQFHHGPTRGGTQEQEKFEDWYTKTLESYTYFFEEQPPEDIWPKPEDRAKAKLKRKIDTKDYWVIRKPRFLRK